MKRFIFFVSFVLLPYVVYCQYEDNISNKEKFISLINSNDFSSAREMLNLINNWSFDENNSYLNENKALDFFSYIERYNISEYQKSNFLLYLKAQCDFFTYYNISQNDFDSAIYFQKISMNVIEFVLGVNSFEYISSLEILAGLYLSIENYSTTEKYLLEILSLLKLDDGNYDKYASTLSDLSAIYIRNGDYNKAEEYIEESLSIYKLYVGESNLGYSYALYNLAMISYNIGNYNKAIECNKRVLEIRESLLGHDNILYAESLIALGVVYRNIGDYILSEKCLLESLNITRRISLENKYYITHYLGNLNGLAILYAIKNDYRKAEEYFIEILEISENIALRIAATSNLAIVYKYENDLIKAEMYFVESYELSKNFYKSNNPEYIKRLLNLGGLYYELKDYDIAGRYYSEADSLLKTNYVSSLCYMTEDERESYWNSIKYLYDFIPMFIYNYYHSNSSISTFAYDNELFTKGLLLTSMNEVRNSILKSGDSLLINQWNELTRAKQVVLRLEEKNPRNPSLEVYRHRADSLEKQLTRSSVAFRESKEQWNINWESVKKQLSQNEVAIEYFSAPLSQDSTMYCALLLRHNSKYPELIPLFEEKEVAFYLDKATKGTTNNLYSFEGEGEHISNIVWSKILSKIKPGETIYFAPTGILHQLAIEYLPYDEQHTMSDIYNMVRLSSTREIVTNKSKEVYKSAVVYGGIHYDLDNKTILTESKCYPELKHRSLENDSINRGSAKFLPGTKDEAEKINKLLTDNKIEAIIYKTKSANEESFKSQSGKHKNILHIATHGFTWTDSTARKQDYFADRMKMQLMGDNQMRGPVIDPLDRCGLLFAGANTALQGKSKELPEGVQDGILTAKEISLMDLRNAELVVLSACETAKGDITSEGVFGLQRAFKMAGAKTIIMSLWKVDDRATQLLMTEFYTNWISKKQPKREAFKNAQNTVKKQYPRPSYWAGFVMLD